MKNLLIAILATLIYIGPWIILAVLLSRQEKDHVNNEKGNAHQTAGDVEASAPLSQTEVLEKGTKSPNP